jgi:hypothetical protein
MTTRHRYKNMSKALRKPTKKVEKEANYLWENENNPGFGWRKAENYLKEKGYNKREILVMNIKWAKGEYFYSD